MPNPPTERHEAKPPLFVLIRYHLGMPLDWANMQVKPAERGRVRCEPTWQLDLDWSKRLVDYDLWLVWAGRGRMRIDDQPLELRPGVCLWVRPGHLYPAEQDPKDRLGVSYCHFSLVDGDRTYPRDGEPAGLGAIVHRVDDLGYADGVMRRAAEVTDEAVAATLIRGLLMDLDTDSSAEARASGTPLLHRQVALRAAATIRISPGEAPAVVELAEEAGYSPDHFTRVFVEVMGVTPTAFIVQQRIARAAQLLRETAMSVSQVADALGYSDVYFFSRQFKQKTGMSPTGYRAG